MSLYKKYRPNDFAEVLGNAATVKSLEALLEKPKQEIPHSFLFTGGTGCGKTTLSRILARKLDCDIEYDFNEIDSADFRGIDSIREIRRNMNLRPMGSGTCRVWLLDECHKLTNDAQNALLKALEDTPSHAYFILATTDPQNLLATLVGRCTPFEVVPLDEREMTRLLRKVAKREEKTISPKVVEILVEQSLGHPRNALVLLEKIMVLPPEEQAAAAEKYAEEQSQAIELCRALIGKQPWSNINKILKNLKDDPESVRRMILSYATSILLKSDNSDAYEMAEPFTKPFFDKGTAKADFVLATYKAYYMMTSSSGE